MRQALAHLPSPVITLEQCDPLHSTRDCPGLQAPNKPTHSTTTLKAPLQLVSKLKVSQLEAFISRFHNVLGLHVLVHNA